MDSTSLLLHLLAKNKSVYALSFDYGQKHKLELFQAKKNIELLKSQGYNIIHKIIDIKSCKDVLSSSLTEK